MAVFAAAMTGAAESLGETAIIGFLNDFPSYFISEVSSGLGFGGVFATVILLWAKALGFSIQTIFFVCSPVILIYFFTFKWIAQ